MHKNINLFTTLVLTTISLVLFGQPTFSNQTQKYKNDFPTRSTYTGAILDMDGDLVDDLVVLDQGLIIKWYKSKGQNFGFELIDTLILPGIRKNSISAGDLNNDGTNELLIQGNKDNLQIISVIGGKLTLKNLNANYYAQATNTVDINNDGWLDYFACDDDSFNKIYLNDQSGNLVLNNFIDERIGDTSDGSGNYGSAWVDLNGDMKPDLALSKCRAGVNSPADLRRINKLFLSNPDGSYTEKGSDFGFNSGAQSWITLFGDIDNDGDLDAYVVNHYASHELLENIDNKSFQKIPLSTSLLSLALNGIMRDFDNDGWLDIILIGLDEPLLLHNNRNKTFTRIRNFSGLDRFNSMSVGDLNDDGFIDFYGHNFNLQNGRAQDIDELLLNNPNGNHYLKVSLKGSISNASGVGAKLLVYTPSATYMRYVQGGESYSTYSSHQQHFGLGTSELIDSLVIYWPSGQIDKFTDLMADNTYFAQEGKCITLQLLIYDQLVYIYDQDIEVTAPAGFNNYLWSNGETDRNIRITEPSTLHVTFRDRLGCQYVSKPVNIVYGCFSEKDRLINISEDVLWCKNESLVLSAVDAAAYLWSTGATTQSITINEAGNYFVYIRDECNKEFLRKVSVILGELDYDVKGDTVQQGNRATLTSTTRNTKWFLADEPDKLLFVGTTFVTPPLEETTTYQAQGFTSSSPWIGFVGEKEFPSSYLYSSDNINGDLIIEVINPVFIQNLKVNTDLPGIRKIVILTDKGVIVYEKTFLLGRGIARLIIEATLTIPGKYRITTDEAVNLENFGFKSPRLVRTQLRIPRYPYELKDDFRILGTSSGSLLYYYFYDLEVGYDLLECSSSLREVKAIVETSSSTQYPSLSHPLEIIPNPIISTFRIQSMIDIKGLKLYNLQGLEVGPIDIKEETIDISSLPNGLYIIEIAFAVGKTYKKIVKTN